MRTLITLGATVVIAGLIGMGAAFGIGTAAKDSTTVGSTASSSGSSTSTGSGGGQALFPSLSGSSGFSAAYGSR